MMELESCRDCGRTLDAFAQCWYCDTYGTPKEQAKEQAEDETLDERLKSLRPGLPCCGEGGACTEFAEAGQFPLLGLD